MRMPPSALLIVDAAGSGCRQGHALTGALCAALTAVLAGTPKAEIKAKGIREGWTSAWGERTKEPAFTQNC